MKSSSIKATQADQRMHRDRRRTIATESAVAPKASGSKWWYYALGGFAALVIAFIIYGPAINGPFVLDDLYLPFMSPAAAAMSARSWLSVRPLLMATFWFNYSTSGVEPYWYHWVNIVLHSIDAVLIYAVVRRFLTFVAEIGSRRELLSLFAAGVFLVHPVQTESVSYVASRSESLSVLFFLAAFAIFLYRRREAVSVGETVAILFLFGAAALTKEHTVVLPVLLLLTDYYFNPGFTLEGIKRNWKLYVPIAAGGFGSDRVGGQNGQPFHVGRLWPEGLDVVRIPLHAIPSDLCILAPLSASGRFKSRSRFPHVAEHFGPRCNRVPTDVDRSRRIGVAVSPRVSAGQLRLLRVSGTACAYFVGCSRARCDGRASVVSTVRLPAASDCRVPSQMESADDKYGSSAGDSAVDPVRTHIQPEYRLGRYRYRSGRTRRRSLRGNRGRSFNLRTRTGRRAGVLRRRLNTRMQQSCRLPMHDFWSIGPLLKIARTIRAEPSRN